MISSFFAGYLTIADAKKLSDFDTLYSLRIPNNEVKQAFKEIMIESIAKSLNLLPNQCKEFLPNLLNGNIKEFYEIFRSYVMTTTSMYQT